jgi:hypothetical protein
MYDVKPSMVSEELGSNVMLPVPLLRIKHHQPLPNVAAAVNDKVKVLLVQSIQ